VTTLDNRAQLAASDFRKTAATYRRIAEQATTAFVRDAHIRTAENYERRANELDPEGAPNA